MLLEERNEFANLLSYSMPIDIIIFCRRCRSLCLFVCFLFCVFACFYVCLHASVHCYVVCTNCLLPCLMFDFVLVWKRRWVMVNSCTLIFMNPKEFELNLKQNRFSFESILKRETFDSFPFAKVYLLVLPLCSESQLLVIDL